MDGRAAAVAGAVVSFEVTKAGVRAEVRRADGRREETRLGLRPLPPAALRRALSAMASRARFAADLLAGPDSGRRRGRVLGHGPHAPSRGRRRGRRVVHVRRAAAVRARGRRGRAPRRRPRGRPVPRLPPARPPARGASPGPAAGAPAASRLRHRPAPRRAAARDARGPPEPLPAAILERPELFYRPGEPAAALRPSSRRRSTPRPSSRASARRRSTTPRPRGSSSSSTARSASAPASASRTGSGGGREGGAESAGGFLRR